MKKEAWRAYRADGTAVIAVGPFAGRETVVARLRQGPGPEAQRETTAPTAGPPSRWTLRAIRATFAALHEYSPGQYAVFVMRGGKLSVDFVQVGLKDLVSAEIKSGLQPGDVISTGAGSIQ